MKRNILISICLSLTAIASHALEIVKLMGGEEYGLNDTEILHLPGLGLGLRCGPDSLMLLDNSDLSSVHWLKPMEPRSLVVCGGTIYAAQGDSIFRPATNDTPEKFIGRLDNEQFTLHAATDSTFYALTADEDFSCVYEIKPGDRTMQPFFSVQGPLLKLATRGENTIMWIDEQLVIARPDGKIVPLFSSPTLSDMALTQIGVMAATDEGLWWITEPGKGGRLVDEPVKNVWWDDSDVLYYLTKSGDLYAALGLSHLYQEQNPQ